MGSTPLLRPLQQQPLAELGPQGSGVQLRSTPAAVPGHCQETRWILPTQDALQPWTVTPHHQSLPRTHLKAIPGSKAPMAESAKYTRDSPLPDGVQKRRGTASEALYQRAPSLLGGVTGCPGAEGG